MELYNQDYEVAIEVLGQSKAPLVEAYWDEERNNPKPNRKLQEFVSKLEVVIDDFMDDLSPDDTYIIQKILDPNNKLFRR